MKRAVLLVFAAASLAPAAERSDAWVRRRVAEVRDSDVQAWRKIPWADDLLDAAAVAKRDARLMFVFSHEGNIETGRCCGGARDMRVSSLSDERVIGLVSRYFVPVWISRDRYQQEKSISREETLLIKRIDASRHAKKLEGGTVCVYVCTGRGDVLATLPVQKASKPDLLVAFLKRLIAAENLEASRLVGTTEPPAPRPKSVSGRLFAVRTRYDDTKENRGTSRDVVELSKDDWLGFIPPETAQPGRTWKVPRETAEKLLRHAYPPVAHWDAKLAKLSACALTAAVRSNRDGDVSVRLEGRLDLIYPYKGEPTDGRVTAKLVGMLRCDAKERSLASLELASDGATYVWHWQNKAQVRATTITVELLE